MTAPDTFLKDYYPYKAAIVRDKPLGAMFLDIACKGPWRIYAEPKAGGVCEPVAKGEGNAYAPLNIAGPVRAYFKLVTDNFEVILSEPHLPLEGGFNFRDMGGLPTQDGRYVKWGKVFRADELNRLTEGDLKYLAAVPLISIVDFRAKSEIEHSADKHALTVKNNYKFSIDPGNLAKELDELTDFAVDETENFMRNIYVSLASEKIFIKQYEEFFALLQNEQEVPLLFHCSAGKDRTGMGAALFLFSLGVSQEVILKDYLLSNVYLNVKYRDSYIKHPTLKSLFQAKEEYLLTGLNILKNSYGSVENYLEKELKVNLNLMKKLYLY